jgi:hypothetical protein
MEEIYKEVLFDKYCKTCEHDILPESEHPCNDCLDNPINTYSHKPVNWKEKNINKKFKN